MNAQSTNQHSLLWLAFCFLALNYLNLITWSIGGSVSPIFFGLAFLIFAFYSLFTFARNWALLATFLCFILIILGAPLSDWDARYIWFFHAKRIFMDNNLYAPLDNYFSASHNDYPNLVPAIAASFAKKLGFWNEYFPRLAIIPALVPVFLVIRLLCERNEVLSFSILGVLFISKNYLVNGYMDAILGLYIAVACLLLVKLKEFPNDKKIISLLVGIFLTLPMIKNEGVLALLLLNGCFISVYRREKTLWLIPVGVFFAYYILWKAQVGKAGIETTDLFVSGIVDRALKRLSSGSDLMEIVISMVKISWIYFVALSIFIWKRGQNKKAWIVPAFFATSYTLAMFVIYLITSLDLKDHLIHSVDRVLLPVNLVIFLTLSTTVGSEETRPKRQAIERSLIPS